MAVPFFTRSRFFGIGIASATLAFAACGHHNTPTPSATPTTTPTAVVTAGPTSSPCILSLGLAYEPDGGNGNGFTGVQVTHFEGNSQYLCGAGSPTSTPIPVAFSSSVGALAFDSETEDAVALLKSPSGGYSLVQDLFGAVIGSIVPAGTPYDLDAQPPTAAPTAGATAAASAPIIPDAGNAAIVGTGSYGVAIVTGVGASPPAIVALTSLQNAPPQYGESILYNQATFSDATAPPYPRSILRISPATTVNGTAAFARGPQDLVVFAVKTVGSPATGYQFNLTTEDPTLGSGIALRGNGNIAFDPADGTRALIGGTTTGGQTTLTLVTGLPLSITKTSTITMPAAIHSIAISANGLSALVATDDGIVVVTGVNSSALTEVAPFSISSKSVAASELAYTNCMGTASEMTTIYSVGYSTGFVPGSTIDQYLVALGTAPGISCPSGRNATLVAIPFDPNTGTVPVPTATPTASPSPSPTPTGSFTPTPTASPSPPPVFVQNNIIAPPTGSDLLVVH